MTTYTDEFYEDEDSEDDPIEVTITFDYVPGSPAYTPRGEYLPTDPPDPPEINIRSIMPLDKRAKWQKPSDKLANALWAWANSNEMREAMFWEGAQERRNKGFDG